MLFGVSFSAHCLPECFGDPISPNLLNLVHALILSALRKRRMPWNSGFKCSLPCHILYAWMITAMCESAGGIDVSDVA